MIDIANSIYFYDDRDKYEYAYKLKTILFIDDEVCLCVAQCTDKENPDEKFYFHLESGEVLNSEFQFWQATQDEDWILQEFLSENDD